MDGARVLSKTRGPRKERITTPQEGTIRQDIYLIHGFRGTKYSHYRDNLVRWVMDSARSLDVPGNAVSTTYEFGFHGSSVPETGKAVLEDAVLKLRQHVLENLRQTSVDDDVSDLEHETTSTLRHDTTSANGLHMNTILFIAHGFGSWVVKDALAHPSSHGITHLYGRTAVDFINLDVPKGYSTAYGEYLKQNWKRFLELSSPQQGTKFHELIFYLQEIDKNFNVMMYQVSGNLKRHLPMVVKPQRIYRGQDLEVWMSENRDCIRPAQTGRYHLPMIGKMIGSRRDNFIAQLPTLQNVIQNSISNLMSINFPETSASQQELAISRPVTTPTILREDTLASIHAIEARASDTPRDFPQTGAGLGIDVRPLTDDSSISVSSNAGSEPRISRSDRPSVYQQAENLLQEGQLEDAYQLFTALSKTYRQSDQSQVSITIDIQVATVKIYRGDYMNSEKEFLNIHQRLEDLREVNSYGQWAVERQNLCQRLLAHCWLLAGKWDKAATKIQSLLDEDPGRFNVRLCRDLALADAYLGQYTKARKALELAQKRLGDPKDKINSTSEDPDIGAQQSTALETTKQASDHQTDHQTRKATMHMDIATVEMLAGDYKKALKFSSDALDSMKRIEGAKHFKTLAIAVLTSWCLVYNGEYIEAEALCLATYKATTQSLGHDHPQSLEIMGCLVHIFRCQGRFAEAIGTGLSLEDFHSARLEKYPDYIYPQAIHSKFLLATAFLASGDYATSSKKLDEVVKLAEANEMKHPEIFRYKSEKARALLYLGNIEEAQDLAFMGVVEQFKLNTWFDGTALEVGPHEERLSRLNNILTRLCQDTVSSTTLHPFLASNLQILANIEVRRSRLIGRKDDAVGLAAARGILEALQRYYSNMASRNIVSLSSVNMDLATLYKEYPIHSRGLPKAIALFTQAYEDRKSHMGDNIDTLCALRELTISQCLLDLSYPDAATTPLDRVKVVSNNILGTLESRLGQTHQETLASQLWYLTVDHLLPDNDSKRREKMMEDLVNNLSDPLVLKERFIETLLMKRQLAGLLDVTGSREKAGQLIDSAISELDKALMNADKRVEKTIQDLRKTFVGLKKTTDDEV
ncbi:hypothetical protein F4802DRAFT_588431 [Xylaria palmicola]|nr:hypothetical protein F4802DRAFT_588431 [Xylaria palmicola]